jgi:hypothetical protein
MELNELLLTILKLGGTAFVLFLFGYAGYSIVKRGKRKRLREQERYDKLEMERMRQFINTMDDDLKKEIDSAVRQHNKQNGIEDKCIENNTNDFAEKLGQIITKGIQNKLLYKFEQKYNKYNAKYNFDENGKLLNKMKNTFKTGIDKAMDSLDKWEEKNSENFKKWK